MKWTGLSSPVLLPMILFPGTLWDWWLVDTRCVVILELNHLWGCGHKLHPEGVGIAEFMGQESCLLFWYFPHSIGGFKLCLKLKQRLQTQLFIWSFLSLWCHPVDLHISVSGRAAPRYRSPGQEWLWLPESPWSPAMIPATLSGRQVPEVSDHLSRRSRLLLLVSDGASCTR